MQQQDNVSATQADTPPPQPQSAQKIVLLGMPNVGKSSIFNALMGGYQQVVTSKSHTTINTLSLPLYEDMDLVDLPGIVPRKRRREHKRMHLMSLGALDDAALGLAVFDAVKLMRWTIRKSLHTVDRDDPIDELITQCQEAACPVIAVINKIDKIKDREMLLSMAKQLMDTGAFTEIIPVNCTKIRGLQPLVRYLQVYSDNKITDRSNVVKDNHPIARLMPLDYYVQERLREQLFRAHHAEIPYLTRVVLDKTEETEEKIKIWGRLLVVRKSHMAIVVGKEGDALGKVGKRARLALQRQLKKPVDLMLQVQVAANSQNRLTQI